LVTGGNELTITDNTGGTLSYTSDTITGGGAGILSPTATPITNTFQTSKNGAFTDNGQQLILAGSTNTNPVTGTFTENTTTPSTVQSLINAINQNASVGAKAQLINGLLQITDPLDRGDLQVSTTDTLLGAPDSGAPTSFVNQTTTSTGTNPNQLVGSSIGLSLTTALTNGAVTSFTVGGKTFTYTASASSTVGTLINAINTPSSDPAGLQAYLNSAGSLVVTDPNNDNNIAVSSTNTETVLGTYSNPTLTTSAATNIFLSDSTAIGSSQIAVTIGGLSSSSITNGTGTNAINLATTDLNTQNDAQTALTALNQAIANVASTRGTLGASVNRLTAASNVINSQVQNLTSAENTITAADIPTAVANLTKYSILEQTGISALAQANQQQQLVLKLLQ
jgi:flagellin